MQGTVFTLSILALLAIIGVSLGVFLFGIYNPLNEAINNYDNHTLTATEFIWGTVYGVLSAIILWLTLQFGIIALISTLVSAFYKH